MSSLVKKLIRQRKMEPQPMGFATSRATPEKPRLLLIASIAAEKASKASAALDSLDAIIVEVNRPEDLKTVEKICKDRKETPTGGWLKNNDVELLPAVMDSSCDFVVFPSTASSAIIQKDKIGRILQLDDVLTEGMLRTVNDLPIDVILLSDKGQEGPLTLQRLMTIRRVVTMLIKPVIVPVSAAISSPELQTLWDMGISSVLIESVGEPSADKLAELRNNIGRLTLPTVLKKERISPMLPHLQPETPAPSQDEEEEENDD